MDFPIFNSKALSDGKTYVLSDPAERLAYFHAKMGKKIEDIKVFLDSNSFVGYLMAKKQAGKGTYSKMLQEVLGVERFEHISVGDIVRKYHKILETEFEHEKDGIVTEKLRKLYRGPISLDDAIKGLLGRSQDKVSVQDELILALLKIEIDFNQRKALFVDGLPRTSDQISYSLFFRDLINYREDPDFFVLIQLDEDMIDARMKNRVVCPNCHTSKNTFFNPSAHVGWDEANNNIYLICDNNACSGFGKTRMIGKEGDLLGKESIRERLTVDDELIKKAYALHGISKILLRSAIPVNIADTYLEPYEIQPKITYTREGSTIKKHEETWIFEDDSGVKSCTMYSAVYVLNLIDQLHKLLGL